MTPPQENLIVFDVPPRPAATPEQEQQADEEPEREIGIEREIGFTPPLSPITVHGSGSETISVHGSTSEEAGARHQ